MAPLMVTGGCGFIGSNFIRYLLETDSALDVVNVDALTYAGNLANLADLAGNPRYRFVKADVADREAPSAGRPWEGDVAAEPAQVAEEGQHQRSAQA